MHIFTQMRVTALALAALLLSPAARADAPQLPAPAVVRHAGVAPHHNDAGDIKRGLRNEVETSNWSGYAIGNFRTGELYRAAEATWTVHLVGYVRPRPVCHTYVYAGVTHEYCGQQHPPWEYSSSWVGIGGYCENARCTAVDQTLIQLGTEQDIASDGKTTQYYAWIEMLPNYPLLISPKFPNCNDLSCAYSVSPGDVITASLACQSNCTPGSEQTWLLAMTNRTKNWSWSTTVTYASSLLSAVWIQEAPATSNSILPLANFAKVSFDPTVNNGAAPNFGLGKAGRVGPDAVLMVNPHGETSNPSIAEMSPILDAFSTCWGNNISAIAGCRAP